MGKHMKKGKVTFWILIIIELVLMFSDGALTYIGTPDLSLEANPLVAYFGLGWGALFIANFIFVILFVGLVYYAFVKYESPMIPYKTFKEYTSMLFFNRPDKFYGLFYKMPKNWKPVIATFGYVFGIAMPVGRAILVFEWILYLTKSPFRTVYYSFANIFPYSRVDMCLCCLLAVVLMFAWLIKEYKNNKRLLLQNVE